MSLSFVNSEHILKPLIFLRYPNYTPILLRAIELWYHDPQVTTPVLKLFAELVQNRSQRLQFDVSSPNGILLFREASKIICSYGSRILNVEVPKEQTYPLKLKGISICFSMLKAALCGSYVNFGVFRLYGDETLDNALNIFVKLLLSIPQSDLLDYPKLSQTYYVLLECLAQDHMSFLSTLEPQVFLYILSSISEGLTALDTMVCTGCCATLDHIVTYLFKQLTQKVYPGKKQRVGLAPSSDMFLKVLEMHPEILQQILSTVLNVIMFEDCRNQWSMSRPLLGLILLNEDYFNQMRESIIRSQPPDKQAAMVQWFENLMDGIERNLLTKNRDKFTQNLSMFRRDINDSLKGPNVNTSSASDMMTS
jgi:exportin-7